MDIALTWMFKTERRHFLTAMVSFGVSRKKETKKLKQLNKK